METVTQCKLADLMQSLETRATSECSTVLNPTSSQNNQKSAEKYQQELEILKAKRSAITNDSAKEKKLFDAMFYNTFIKHDPTISKGKIKDAFETLEYHFKKNESDIGIANTIDNLSAWNKRPQKSVKENLPIDTTNIPKGDFLDSLAKEIEFDMLRPLNRAEVAELFEPIAKHAIKHFQLEKEASEITLNQIVSKQSQLDELSVSISPKVNLSREDSMKAKISLEKALIKIGRTKAHCNLNELDLDLHGACSIPLTEIEKYFIEVIFMRSEADIFKTSNKSFNLIVNNIKQDVAKNILSQLIEKSFPGAKIYLQSIS